MHECFPDSLVEVPYIFVSQGNYTNKGYEIMNKRKSTLTFAFESDNKQLFIDNENILEWESVRPIFRALGCVKVNGIHYVCYVENKGNDQLLIIYNGNCDLFNVEDVDVNDDSQNSDYIDYDTDMFEGTLRTHIPHEMEIVKCVKSCCITNESENIDVSQLTLKLKNLQYF